MGAVKSHGSHVLTFLAAAIPVAGLPQETQDTINGEQPYGIQPGDVLEISVWSEPELERQVLVAPDGTISFPLAGELIARDKSVSELRREISAQLAQFLTDPIVTVSLSEVLGNKIYVIGQVASPGAYVVNPRVDVMQALSIAGGTTPYASLKDIVILRRNGGGEQEALSFRYDDVAMGRNLDQNVILQSGDVVIVR